MRNAIFVCQCCHHGIRPTVPHHHIVQGATPGLNSLTPVLAPVQRGVGKRRHRIFMARFDCQRYGSLLISSVVLVHLPCRNSFLIHCLPVTMQTLRCNDRDAAWHFLCILANRMSTTARFG